MADWRFARGWSDAELEARLIELGGRARNFDVDEPNTPDRGWRRHASETRVAREREGPPVPGGAFERLREAVVRYEFSDPRIVVGHFDPDAPLRGRRMLLELRPLAFRFLAGAMVSLVREDDGAHQTVFGYRYDTLRGHPECGWEWFLLTKSHATGEVRFRIEAAWRPGDFPNWWSRVGFRFLAPWYQRRWVRRAHQRLRHIADTRPRVPVPEPEARLLHGGPTGADMDEERR